jgi:hypothetical protein
LADNFSFEAGFSLQTLPGVAQDKVQRAFMEDIMNEVLTPSIKGILSTSFATIFKLSIEYRESQSLKNSMIAKFRSLRASSSTTSF